MKKIFLKKALAGVIALGLLAIFPGGLVSPAYGETDAVNIPTTTEEISDTGSIQVTKEISMDSPDDSLRVNDSFFVAVFSSTMERVSDIREIVVTDSLPSTVTFEGLPLNQTYYVYETDNAGQIIAIDGEDYGDIIDPENAEWTYIAYEGRIVQLTEDAPVGYVTITNYFFPEIQPEWYGTIMVLLSVSSEDGQVCPIQELYAALFYDEACTMRATEIFPLEKQDDFTWSAMFERDMDGRLLVVGEVYYLALTDKAGNPIQDIEKEFDCIFSQSSNPVSIAEETIVELDLDFQLDASPQTGSTENPIWFITFIASSAIMVRMIIWKRKLINE